MIKVSLIEEGKQLLMWKELSAFSESDEPPSFVAVAKVPISACDKLAELIQELLSPKEGASSN